VRERRYVGATNAAPILVEGLLRLSTRGPTTSAGVAVCGFGGLRVHKREAASATWAATLAKRFAGKTGNRAHALGDAR